MSGRFEGGRRVTLGDIAAVASVSVATVSRALRGDPQISPPTRERIRKLADGLGYVPNVAARSLVSQLTHTFGLITPDVTDPIHGQVVTAFHERAAHLGYSVIVANGYWDPDTEREAFRTFTSHRVDGVVTMGCSLRPTEVVERVAPTPVVFIGSENRILLDSDDDLAKGCIQAEDLDGVRQIVDHLLERGYQHISYLSGRVPASQLLRRYALMEAISERGRTLAGLHSLEEANPEGFLKAARAIKQQGPDAVVCYDDKTALNLMDSFRDVGVRVPDDMAVVGFDDIPFARISNPRLTTVSQPVESMTEMAANMLVQALEEGEMPDSVSVPVQLIVRESSPDRRGADG